MADKIGCSGWGLAIVLTLIFLVLQVTGIICWTWFWILSPIIIMSMLDVLIFIGFIILMYFINK